MTEIDYGYQVEVIAGSDVLSVEVANPYLVEVSVLAADPAAYVEPIDFSRQGPLSAFSGSTEKPIVGGTFSFATIGARVGSFSTGADIIVDVLKNGVSIFVTPADRITIPAGQKDAVVGSWGNVTVTDGDYLTIDIAQVGSVISGSDLVVGIRLDKVA
jgi:hypothetical protein